ncbi:hypothetical protein BRAS3843_500012 [Bradyrhizobium sp. STM 3843]|nr:hypothetical protein BRAS3843_500012 [Bradyrhizobium sp. STM 3843]
MELLPRRESTRPEDYGAMMRPGFGNVRFVAERLKAALRCVLLRSPPRNFCRLPLAQRRVKS